MTTRLGWPSWAALLIAAFAIGAVATPAQAGGAHLSRAGQLDRSFGARGRVVIPANASERGRMFVASTGDGRLVVAGLGQVVELTPQGRVDPSFGHGGRVPLPSAPDAEFSLSGLAVDGDARVLIAGTSRPVSSPEALRPGTVVVERLLPDGSPDTGFGNGGTVASTFGFPVPPTAPAGPTTPSEPQYAAPAVEASGLAVDAGGRPVLTGDAVTQLIGCETYLRTPYRWEPTEGFLARLTTAGEPDLSFGAGGVRREGGVSRDRLPLIDRLGDITYSQAPLRATCPGRGEGFPFVLRGLDASGNPLADFDACQSSHFLYTDAAAEDPGMRSLLLGGRPAGFEIGRLEVDRVATDGSLDRSFGNGGRRPIGLPETASLNAIAADPKSRVLLAGARGDDFYLWRLTGRGRLDSRFGVGGKVRTRFGRLPATAVAMVVDPRGRIVVAGVVKRRSPGGKETEDLAVARYLPGR